MSIPGMPDPAAVAQADPRIAATAVLSGPDQSAPSTLLVLPDADWLAVEARAAAAAERRALRSWEATYDVAYRKPGAATGEATGPNFAGWISSFTREPIPLADMHAWLADITTLLLSLPHDRVREIGCGTGLLVQAVAPHCRSYDASDLSGVGIERLRAWLATKLDLAHVTAAQRAAHEVPPDAPEADLVVINSVAQHFPGLGYLEAVLDAAWAGLAPGGHIVVGDVRLAALLPAFISAVETSRAPPHQDVAGLRQSIHAAWLSQSELVIDPGFFHRFAAARGGGVTVRLKPGRGATEMTRYRCDVVLGRAAGTLEATEAAVRLADPAALRDWLAADRPAGTRAVLRAVANARVQRDVALRRAIRSAPASSSLAELLAASDADLAPAVDPADLSDLCAAHGVPCMAVPLPGDADGRFDLWIGGHDDVPQLQEPAEQQAGALVGGVEPLTMQALRRLVASLHTMLAASITPDRMPARILPVLNIDDLSQQGYEALAHGAMGPGSR